MKSINLFLVSFTFSIATFSQTRSLKDIIGSWQIPGNFGSLEFLDSNRIATIMNGKKVAEGTYVMDFTQTPIWLDVTFRQSSKSATVQQIVEFIDDDTIRWQSTAGTERPKAFEQNRYGAPMTLTRKK